MAAVKWGERNWDILMAKESWHIYKFIIETNLWEEETYHYICRVKNIGVMSLTDK
jgi:hypothetical protein